MLDPLSLTSIGGVALAEGIKFLYGQAAEILKRWRERKTQAGKADPSARLPETVTVPVEAPKELDGTLSTATIHLDRVAPLENELTRVLGELGNYANGIQEPDASDQDLIKRVDGLRRMVETIYGQRVTFKGENRPPSGEPLVIGSVDVQQVAGYVAGIRAQQVSSGELRGHVNAGRVEQGAEAVGVDLGTINKQP